MKYNVELVKNQMDWAYNLLFSGFKYIIVREKKTKKF